MATLQPSPMSSQKTGPSASRPATAWRRFSSQRARGWTGSASRPMASRSTSARIDYMQMIAEENLRPAGGVLDNGSGG